MGNRSSRSPRHIPQTSSPQISSRLLEEGFNQDSPFHNQSDEEILFIPWRSSRAAEGFDQETPSHNQSDVEDILFMPSPSYRSSISKFRPPTPMKINFGEHDHQRRRGSWVSIMSEQDLYEYPHYDRLHHHQRVQVSVLSSDCNSISGPPGTHTGKI